MAKKYKTPTSQSNNKHVDTNVDRKTREAIDNCIFLTPALEEQFMPSVGVVRPVVAKPVVSTGPVEEMTDDEMFDNMESLLNEMESQK